MIKKIFLCALVSLILSSCSTYNNFGERKYYDFPRSSNAVVNETKDFKSKDAFIVNTIVESSENSSPSSSGVALAMLHENNVFEVDQAPVSKTVKSISKVLNKKADRKVIKNDFKTKNHSFQSEKRPGRLWWIWAIVAFVGIMLMLFVSAYLGLIILLAGITFLIIGLIKYAKSK